MKKRTLAQFRSDGTPTIEVNKKLNDDFWKRDARSVEIGWAAQDNPILHELGHYIDFICNKEKYNKQSENKRFFGETKSLIEKEVSIYAATDQWELEAELYAGIMRGKVYSNNVLNLSRISQSDNDIIKRLLSYGTGQDVCLPSEDISKQFKNMMKVLFQQEGSSFSINIMADKDVQKMIETHSSVLNGSFRQVEMSEAMRKRLERSNYVFSGLKTFHELNEAFPSLLDENGNRKTFERFLNDVRKIDETYNSNYLRAEFNFVQASAEMAAKWERFMQDGDRYYLQYRTAGDAKVRPTHAEMAGITLPASDPFWAEFYPPNGWGCRCSVVQVRKSKYPATDHEEAMARGESALELDKKGMFRFNAGMEQKTMPDYNPYTIKRCKDCDMNNGKMELVFVPENELCAACKLVRTLANADAKQIKKQAKPLQGTDIRIPKFPHPIRISRASISEWTNQPNKYYQEKNQMLLRIQEVMNKAEYIGFAPPHNPKKGLVKSHIFSIDVRGEEQCIIVLEWAWGEYTLHSISDNPKKIKEYIKNG